MFMFSFTFQLFSFFTKFTRTTQKLLKFFIFFFYIFFFFCIFVPELFKFHTVRPWNPLLADGRYFAALVEKSNGILVISYFKLAQIV